MFDNEFKIEIPITRTRRDSDGNLWIEGVASSVDIDDHGTVFSENCQEGFAFDIMTSADTDEPVKVEVEHKGEEEPMNHIGSVREAYVTRDKKLFISAMLDPENPKAVYYWNVLSNPDPKLGRPKKLGFSVNGGVREAHWEYRDDVGKNVRVFDRVKLKKVGIVRAPSNSETWIEKVARSVNWNEVETKENLMPDNEVVTTDEAVVESVEDTSVVRAEEPEVVAEAEVVEAAVVEPVAEATPEVAEVAPVEEVAEVVEAAPEAVVEPAHGVQIVERSEEDKPSVDLYELFEKVTRAVELLETLEPVIRSLDTTNSANQIHEDLSDKVDEDEEEKKEEEEATRSVSVEQEGEIILRGKPLSEIIADAVSTAVEEVSRNIKSLEDKLTAKEAENEELIKRVSKLESSPASKPGGQVLSYESVERSKKMTERERYEEAVQRAKDSGDSKELIKLQILAKMYNY